MASVRGILNIQSLKTSSRTRRFLLCQICLLAEELGNKEGRLGWGEGIFCERGNRGRQADPSVQPKIRWGAPTPKGGGTGVTGVVDRSAQRTVSRAESFPHKGETRFCRVPTMQSPPRRDTVLGEC